MADVAPPQPAQRSPATPVSRRGGRISRIVASFLRLVLVPLIVFGVPSWPILGLLCAVPIIGIVTIPLFLLLTVLLLYSIAWFSYLVMAQADPPPSSRNSALSGYLPFLPYSPLRCLKINWAVLQYSTTAIRVALPAILDWSYRRVMVLGTQGGKGVIKEGILYGSSYPDKRLDIYLPAAFNANAAHGRGASGMTTPGASIRTRKHSTHFAEPSSGVASPAARTGDSTTHDASGLAPVVVVLPSSIPPITWTNRRKTYLQLALRLRRMGYCVVVPDLTTYPEARVEASVVDLRLVLQWVGKNCARYGGDAKKIHLMGHGLSAHLALLTLTQEAVVLSREGFLDHAYRQDLEGEKMMRWDDEEEEDEEEVSSGYGPGAEGPGSSSLQRPEAPARVDSSDSANWVDEPDQGETLPPGAVMGYEPTRFGSSPTKRLASQLGGDFDMPGRSNVSFPTSGSASSNLGAGGSSRAQQQRPSTGPRTTSQAGSSSSVAHAEALISNGLRRVEIYEPRIEVPPIAGLILLAGVSDVIKEFRDESERGLEHLSVLRRSAGPSHTACLLHSPAHLLYASKSIIDVSLLPPKFLLIHGGKDAVVDISQSTLLNTLLTGCGVENVKLRAYRELGHAEAIASLFLGQSKAGTRYSKRILNDIDQFIAA